ncbi:hypothetical protein HNQ82_000820 [Anoxybacillus tengchongensis]|uniref:Uncharacterized protein n=1 Tax=Anoxybacillus tengchongensis TaxID=576944 RepID=A0A7W9YPY3_9BACL|nr:hypothetical protein [Anoxybacillus tengchongensis]MBB6176009.1 hypothetical protein [Anoxybacillus tengchongensis]
MSGQTDIAHDKHDIIFHNMTVQFKEKVLDFYGIRTAPIVRVEAPDLPTIAVNDRRMDFLLMRSSVNRSERAIETVEIAKRIKNEEKQVRLLATIIAVSDKFIDKEYVEKLMESMARVIRMAEERARINESQQTIKKYLSARLGLESWARCLSRPSELC